MFVDGGQTAKPMSPIDVENVLDDTEDLQAKLMAFWETDNTSTSALHKTH